MKGVLLGLAIAALIASCVVNRLMGPRLTGTCDGACAHYISCKSGGKLEDKRRCDGFTHNRFITQYQNAFNFSLNLRRKI